MGEGMNIKMALQGLLVGIVVVVAATGEAKTLTWSLGDWSDGTWNYVNPTWGMMFNLFSDGDNVRFTTGEIGVGLDLTVRPQSIYSTGSGSNLEWLYGTGDVADYHVDEPTTVTIDGGLRKMSNTENFTFSGGTLIQSGGILMLVNATAFGTGPITLDNGKFVGSGTKTMTNNIMIEAGGGSLYPNNSELTYSGTVTLRGNLLLDGGDWDRARLTGPIVLEADADITGGNVNANTLAYTTISGPVSGQYRLGINVNTGGRITIVSSNWDIAGLIKKGAGTLKIDGAEVCGTTLKIEAGKLWLSSAAQSQTVSELWLGGVKQANEGTYGSTASTATYTDDTYFTGTGMVTLDLPPKTGTIIAIL